MFDSTLLKWKDLSLHINGVHVIDFTELFYTSEQEVEEAYSEGDEAASLQSGNRKYYGSMKMYETAWNALYEAAVAAGYRDPMDLPWVIVAAYKATAASAKATDTIPNVRITDFRKGMDQNSKTMTITANFKSLRPIHA